MPNQSRPATLKSMATALGVHVSTVSRVLNGDPAGVERAASAEVVARIRALAKELDYRPNTQASNLKLRKSQEICVLMPRLTDLVMATIYDSIDSAAEQAGLKIDKVARRESGSFLRWSTTQEIWSITSSDPSLRGQARSRCP